MNTDELKNLFERLKRDKKTMIILFVGLIGMLLVLISDIGVNNNDNYVSSEDKHIIYSEYELSGQIEKLIETIDGAGKCKAMISYNSYEETVYARNENQTSDINGESRYNDEYIILDSGSNETGLAIKIILPEIKGVAIVCQGGDDPIVKEQIILSLSALFNISSNRISVAAMAK